MYLAKLKRLNLPKNVEKRYERIIMRNLTLLKRIEAHSTLKINDREDVEDTLFPYGGLSSQAQRLLSE